MADMIVNKNDPTATSYANQEAWSCTDQPSNAQGASAAAAQVQSIARQVLSAGEHDTHLTLGVLKDVVRRMGAMPGQRIVVLISPGFFSAEEFHQEKSDIMDAAIRSSVIVNSLDARGLWNDPRLDASRPSGAANQGFLMVRQDYDRMSAQGQGDVLGEMAYGTGGSLYANNNDLTEGVRQLANTPEAHYVLGFGPQNLKLDGSFHSLKVVVKTVPPMSVNLQARRGYYAPRKASDPEETARGEMEEALFSIDELRDLPVELHTQFFKANDKEATIAVVCRVDARQLQYKKADGRNNNILTILSGLFDHNGNFISAIDNERRDDVQTDEDRYADVPDELPGGAGKLYAPAGSARQRRASDVGAERLRRHSVTFSLPEQRHRSLGAVGNSQRHLSRSKEIGGCQSVRLARHGSHTETVAAAIRGEKRKLAAIDTGDGDIEQGSTGEIGSGDIGGLPARL
jgi:VWFA-related protein